jgi:Ca2+-binding RTX toxin-like protein
VVQTSAVSTVSTVSDDDTIITGNGEDLVVGGNGNDVIEAGLTRPIDHGAVKVLSVNFGAAASEGVVSGVAGAVAASHWNNLAAPDPRDAPPVTGLVFAGGSLAEGVALQVGSNLDSALWRTLGSAETQDQVDPDSQNGRLFAGYLASPGGLLGLDLSGLARHFTRYDVYVYLDADDSQSRLGRSVRQLSDGTTTYYLDDPDGNHFVGEFVEAASMDPAAPARGNYVVFRDLSGDRFSLRIGAEPSLGNLAALSAIQIVGGDDKDRVIIQGDQDSDALIGDNARVTWLGGALVSLSGRAAVAAGTAAGGFQADYLSGGPQGDLLIGGNDADWLDGGEGDDRLFGDQVAVVLFEGEIAGLSRAALSRLGFDPFQAAGLTLLAPTLGGDDTLEGGADEDLIFGQGGNDTYRFVGAGLGHDRLVESDGRAGPNDPGDSLDYRGFTAGIRLDLSRAERQSVDSDLTDGAVDSLLTLFSGSAFEDALGSGFADWVNGNDRDNRLLGGAGDDTLLGGGGADLILGGDGNDIIFGGFGDDLIDGGAGDDWIDVGIGSGYDNAGSLLLGPARNIVLGGSGNDWIRGGDGADLLVGEEGNDSLRGERGDDILLGGAGADYLQGDAGRDILEGGAGQDLIAGSWEDRSLAQERGTQPLGLPTYLTAFYQRFARPGFSVPTPQPADDRDVRVWLQPALTAASVVDESRLSVAQARLAAIHLIPRPEEDDTWDLLFDESTGHFALPAWDDLPDWMSAPATPTPAEPA